jgi:hypothetical protein
VRSAAIVRAGAVALLSGLVLSACTPGVTQGTSPGPVTGAAGGATSLGAQSSLERCPETLGTLAIDDGRNQSWWGPSCRPTRVTSVEPMIRLVAQQSNCFVITSVGNNRLEQQTDRIRQLQRSGDFRAGSNQQRGSASRPTTTWSRRSSSRVADQRHRGRAGRLRRRMGRSGGWRRGRGAAAELDSVTLSLFDLRSGVQIAASEGSSTTNDLSGTLAGLGLGAGAGGAAGLSAFQRTPAGQATVAAFVDAYNKMVVAVRNYRAQEIRGGAGTGGRLRVN